MEFRNRTWTSEENREETLAFLRSHAIAYVCVDMPQGRPWSIPPVTAATAGLAEVRFHGRGRWAGDGRYGRSGYPYSAREPAEWAPRIRELARETSSTHVIMKNAYRDHAPRSACRLIELLEAMPDCPVRSPGAAGAAPASSSVRATP
ncbi:DUF72 domain-containing protein [Actinoallomurus acaciae]|uniref:DUF72 domain-containing protein n=1 Tax=Actinoallomurus acaciae TaxID=502577 RepID=A0ABV5YV97_9ACTN